VLAFASNKIHNLQSMGRPNNPILAELEEVYYQAKKSLVIAQLLTQ